MDFHSHQRQPFVDGRLDPLEAHVAAGQLLYELGSLGESDEDVESVLPPGVIKETDARM